MPCVQRSAITSPTLDFRASLSDARFQPPSPTAPPPLQPVGSRSRSRGTASALWVRTRAGTRTARPPASSARATSPAPRRYCHRGSPTRRALSSAVSRSYAQNSLHGIDIFSHPSGLCKLPPCFSFVTRRISQRSHRNIEDHVAQVALEDRAHPCQSFFVTHHRGLAPPAQAPITNGRVFV